MNNIILTVPEEASGLRLDKWLTSQIEDLTRTAVQNLVESGEVLVNGKTVAKNYKQKAGDVVEINIPEPVELNTEPENIPLDIIYEDSSLLVVNKPKGMVVHPAPGNYSGTLVNALLYHCGDSLSGINGVIRPGIVHRIDKNTSGLVLCAQNAFAAPELAKTAQKCYLALVEGPLPVGSGRIDVPIARRGDSIIGRCVREGGKPSVTEYTVLAASASHALVSCFPVTGRTHQIRVHFSWLGHPLAGDSLYGGHTDIIARHALHCAVLRFNRPADHEPRRVQSPLPEDFLAACCAAYLPDKEEIQTMLQSVLPCAE